MNQKLETLKIKLANKQAVLDNALLAATNDYLIDNPNINAPGWKVGLNNAKQSVAMILSQTGNEITQLKKQIDQEENR